MRTYDDAEAVAELDRRYSTPQLIDQRRRVREIIATRTGEAGLDVGCGPGFLACELAAEVAPAGRIVAIDASSHSVDATSARAAKRGLAGIVRELHRLFLGAGLTLAGAQVFSIIETRYDPDSFGVESIQGTCEAALEDGIPAADIAAWERDLRARHADGEWFFCLNRFIFTATK